MAAPSHPSPRRPVPQPRYTARAAPSHARGVRRDQPGQCRPDPPRPAAGLAGSRAAGAGGRPRCAICSRCARRAAEHLPVRLAAARRRRADAGRLRHASCRRRPACRTSWSAATCEDRRRADRDADGAARPHARARPVDPRRGARRARRPCDQLLPAHAGARGRAAQQLARRPLAVAAGDPAEDAARAQAGERRAVDAVADDPGVHQGRCAAAGVQLLPGGSRRRRRNRPAHRPQHVLRRRLRRRRLRRAIRASSCTARDTARS